MKIKFEQLSKWRWVVLALIVLTIVIMINRRCTDGSDAEYWKGQYDRLKETSEIERAVLTEEIGHATEAITILQKENEILLETRVRQERELASLNSNLEGLRNQEPVQPELESEPLVINLREQIARMSLIIQEQEQIIQGNDKIIFNLKEQYSAQLIISEDYKKLYENEMALHSFAIKRLTVAENRIRGLRFGHSIKNAALVALGIGLVYVIATE